MKAIYTFCCLSVCLSDCSNSDLKTTLLSPAMAYKIWCCCWHGNDNLCAASRRMCRRWGGGGCGVGGNVIDTFHQQTEIFRIQQHVCYVFRYAVTRHNCHCECYYRQYILSLFSFFYLFACLTCFVIIGSNEPVSCPKFYCPTGVYPLSALEQHAVRFV
jgi:hypothetical protein